MGERDERALELYPDLEAVYPELLPAITRQVQQLLDLGAYGDRRHLTDDDIRQIYERERLFVRLVLDGVRGVITSPAPSLLLLLDLDGTAALKGVRQMRPSVVPLLKRLRQDLQNRILIGVLSNKAMPEINEYLFTDAVRTRRTSFGSIVNDGYVYSSRNDTDYYIEYLEHRFHLQFAEILKEHGLDAINLVSKEEKRTTLISLGKVRTLRSIHTEFPKMTILSVDDYPLGPLLGRSFESLLPCFSLLSPLDLRQLFVYA